MLDLSLAQIALAATVVSVGALVQGSVGFGSALVAAPLLALIDPRFVPAPMILVASTLTLAVAYRERRHLNLRAVGWAVAGRVPGTAVGISALMTLSGVLLGRLFAALILVAVVLLAVGKAPARTPLSLFMAGLLAGVMGTVTSVGGPPVALMFHDARGPELRGTLSGYFIISTSVSLVGLALAGLLGREQWLLFALLVPGMLVGLTLSTWTRYYLDRGRTRTAVLSLATVAALGILLDSL